MMQEPKLLGTLLPSSPDFQPIIQRMRQKYNLPEVGPDDDPIDEIFWDDRRVPLEEFRQEIQREVELIPNLYPPETAKIVAEARKFSGKPLLAPWLHLIPEEDQNAILGLYKAAQNMGQFWLNTFGQFDAAIARMLYVYILTGETEEVPNDWVSKVAYIPAESNSGEAMIVAMASQVANPEAVVQGLREEFKRRFGLHHAKVNTAMVSTAYYMQLQRFGKPWDFIVEEFVKHEKIQMPRQRNSQRYAEIKRRVENRLRKRMQRCEKTLSILLEDKKKPASVL